MLFLAIGAFVLMLLWYVLYGRSWLKKKDWAWSRWWFDLIEPIEIVLWRKSETLLFARFKMLVGVLLTVLTQIGTIDLTPLMPFVPDQYEPIVKAAFNALPLLITVLGMADERLRRDTTKPLEIVELPSAVPAPVAAALAKADEAKVEAVAAAATVETPKPGDAPLVKVE